MKEFTFLMLALIIIYLLLSACLYLFQRNLIYFPVGLDSNFQAQEIIIDNDGVKLHGWTLNPGKAKAVIYFGGNSELITHRSEYFDTVFADHSVYLINYRGYGKTEGEPTEAGLFSDALAIYDHVSKEHSAITAYGRSLGSGVAVYLAANRPLKQLILLTPYDSVAAVAQNLYPWFPVGYLIKDRFDSASRAPDISVPVLIASAELDRVIALRHTLALRQRFTNSRVEYQQIAGAEHNDIVDFQQYRSMIEGFIAAN